MDEIKKFKFKELTPEEKEERERKSFTTIKRDIQLNEMHKHKEELLHSVRYCPICRILIKETKINAPMGSIDFNCCNQEMSLLIFDKKETK